MRRQARAERGRYIRELAELIRIPSVAADPARAGDVRRCASWLARQLDSIGMQNVSLIETGRHPVVYADRFDRRGAPTLLIYGHYDVQPAESAGSWKRPPFEPAIVDGKIHGRGASDDKGQLFIHLKALDAWLRERGRLPVNVRCVIEGEEEIGSAGLLRLMERDPARFAADAAIISDMTMPAPGIPAITYGMRGALGLEIEVKGPARDLHSGLFGGAIANPLEILADLLASLHGPDGRVTIDGFYDRVRRVGPGERALLGRAAPSEAEILRAAGAEDGWGERAYSLFERTTIRPSLSINGIDGGYRGAGTKAVIPSTARAKLSFRLVPDQDPSEIDRLLRSHVARRIPTGITCDVRTYFGSPPALVDRRAPALRAAADACRAVYGRAPRWLRSGGTIPVAGAFNDRLGIPTILLGFALPDDGMHGPDERFDLDNFHRGIETSIELLDRLAAQRTMQRTRQ